MQPNKLKILMIGPSDRSESSAAYKIIQIRRNGITIEQSLTDSIQKLFECYYLDGSVNFVPPQCGKTQIANFISESINIEESGTPKPTQGVRIVEFELSNLNFNGRSTNVDIELWDCSGDHKFESCWPALRVGIQGVILVCSPNTLQAATREMELLYNYFVSQPKLSAKQCVLFYNCTDSDDQEDMDALTLSPTFSKVSRVSINLKSSGNRLKIDFSSYITSVLQSLNKDV